MARPCSIAEEEGQISTTCSRTRSAGAIVTPRSAPRRIVSKPNPRTIDMSTTLFHSRGGRPNFYNMFEDAIGWCDCHATQRSTADREQAEPTDVRHEYDPRLHKVPPDLVVPFLGDRELSDLLRWQLYLSADDQEFPLAVIKGNIGQVVPTT